MLTPEQKKRAKYRAWQKAHPERCNARNRTWRKNNPAKSKAAARRTKLKQKYGITEADYDRLVQLQFGVCAICGTAPSKGRRLVVDHCHVTSRVRGLLCANCNIALGMARDSMHLLLQMARYLIGVHTIPTPSL